MLKTQLPNAAVSQIVWVLSELLYHHEKVKLEEFPDEWYRLEQFAAKIRGWLENAPRVVIKLEEAIRQYPIHTVLHRSTVLALLDLRRPAPVFKSMTPPEHCPACQQLLNGSWDCGYCGLEIENVYRHNHLRNESSQPISHLPLFYVVLPDPVRQRVMILNGESPRRVVWEIPGISGPISARLEREHHLLLTDRSQGTVGEYGFFGDCHWSFNTRISNAHRLKEPVLASSYLPSENAHKQFLIVDRGQHRILVTDHHSQIHWEYGIRGEAGSGEAYLDHPAYAEFTHEGTVLIADTGNQRLLEIDPDQNNLLCWSSQGQIELIKPCYAHRLLSGNTLIVDPGAYRVLEVDRNGLMIHECIYYRPEEDNQDSKLNIQNPHTVTRLPNQHVLIADENTAIEINLPAKTLVWSASLSELNFPLEQELEQILDPDEALIQHMEKEVALQLGHFDLETALNRVNMFEGAPTEFLLTLKQYLKELHYQPGDYILREGALGDSMYILASGRVEVSREGKTIAILHAGEIFGEMALILQQRRNADVIASENCKVYQLKKLAFETVLQSSPVIHKRIRLLAESRHQGMSKLDALGDYSGDLKHVKSLLQQQFDRVASIKEQWNNSRRSSYLRLFQPDWRLLYTRIERHLIHEALIQHQHAYEIHVEFGQGHGGRAETAQRLAALSDKLGTLIRIWPDVDALEAGKWENKIVLTLLSPDSRDLLSESLHELPEIRHLQLHSIYF